jgi:hypothetical protein
MYLRPLWHSLAAETTTGRREVDYSAAFRLYEVQAIELELPGGAEEVEVKIWGALPLSGAV